MSQINYSEFDTEEEPVLPRRPRRRKRRRYIPTILPRLILLAFVVAGLLVASTALAMRIARPYEEGAQAAQRNAVLRAQLAGIQTSNIALQRQCDYLNRPDGIENAARAQGFLRPGEISLVLSSGSH